MADIVISYTNKNVFKLIVNTYNPYYMYRKEFNQWWLDNADMKYAWKGYDTYCIFSFENKENAVLFKLTWAGAFYND